MRAIASGVNNAIARSAQLMAVAAIPMAAGITGDSYRDPVAFSNGFGTPCGSPPSSRQPAA